LVLGVWLVDEGRESYEIRSVSDGGFPAASAGASTSSASSSSQNGSGTGLWYSQRLATGEVIAGLLDKATDANWSWEAELQDGSRIRFQLDESSGVQLISQRCVAGTSNWQDRRKADRPEAYAFYNMMENDNGHRFVHVSHGAEKSADFPVIGLTAGWLPAALASKKDREDAALGGQKQVGVRLLGTFCDPFDITTHKSLLSCVADFAPQLLQEPSMKGRGRGRGISLGGRGAPVPFMDDNARVARHFGVPTQDLRKFVPFKSRARLMASYNTSAPLSGGCRRDMPLNMSAGSVRLATSGAPPRPTLSIVCVRWFDYWSDSRPCSDYSILNDGFLVDILQGPLSPGKTLSTQVEIFTVFIRGTNDLLNLNPSHLRAMLKGRNASAWFFLWPSDDGPVGQVRERDFFALCQSLERLPMRIGWPHQSSLYRVLCGKLWIPSMSLNKKFRVPPTVRLHYADFKQSPRKAAQRALESLVHLRTKVWGKPRIGLEDLKGVVKLGFSWCGSDVLPFRGIGSLVRALTRLLNHNGCENPTCLVQERVADVVGEFRVLCMYDKHRRTVRKETIWMENASPSESMAKHSLRREDVGDFSMASHITVDNTGVIKRFFKGDRTAKYAAEEEALATVDHWLKWYSTETPEPPQSTRIDFLVSYNGDGQAGMWTCEVGENGGSLCTVEVHGRNLAALNRAVLKDDSGRFPIEFPTRIPRNRGEKG